MVQCTFIRSGERFHLCSYRRESTDSIIKGMGRSTGIFTGSSWKASRRHVLHRSDAPDPRESAITSLGLYLWIHGRGLEYAGFTSPARFQWSIWPLYRQYQRYSEANWWLKDFFHHQLIAVSWPWYLGWIPLEITGPYTAIPFRPHWPYIISHCCLVGDINPDVARIRLKLILDTLNTYYDRHGVLDEFVVPSFTGKFEMKYEKLKKWMSIMYPVVGCLRSRFHSPCDVVSRSFDHLLKPDV